MLEEFRNYIPLGVSREPGSLRLHLPSETFFKFSTVDSLTEGWYPNAFLQKKKK